MNNLKLINYFIASYDKNNNEFVLSYDFLTEIEKYQIVDTLGNIIVSSNEGNSYYLGTNLPDLTISYKLIAYNNNEKEEMLANWHEVFKSSKFNDKYYYKGELGAIYTKNSTKFRVWSPVAKSIKLRIYETGTPIKYENIEFINGDDSYQEYEMRKALNGVWECILLGDYSSKYYTYIVDNYLYHNEEVVDPYAKSTGINGLRGMIVDFSKTNPIGWENIKLTKINKGNLCVYESHIADLTSSLTWNGDINNSRLFKGFYEANTSYKGVKTGFDHIKELGVNAVQLLPIFDQTNDERPNKDRFDGTKREFNWGYNPLNYNSLDGIYSSDPYDGYCKIREFKELVMSYNRAGIGIIMDVVYNHVNELIKSNFDVLVPHYYFRYKNNDVSDGSACGNETASELLMFRKFMVDSTEFWAKEYKLLGFRFDLMGIHDIKTMNVLTENLINNVFDGIVVYGEPWYASSLAIDNESTPAIQINMNEYKGYGCFNDKIRDGLIKGGLNGPKELGWVTNFNLISNNDIIDIKSGIKAHVLSKNPIFDATKCLNYVTCHDNYTLYDRIVAAGIKDENIIKKMAILANSIILTSQGISFILSGEEILRTKYGSDNSYNLSYEINEINYENKIKYLDVFNVYKKLIDIKTKKNLFNLSNEECKKINFVINKEDNVISYDIVDIHEFISYRIIHSNGYISSKQKTVDLSGYTLYLDTLNCNLELSKNTIIGQYQTIIAYKKL